MYFNITWVTEAKNCLWDRRHIREDSLTLGHRFIQLGLNIGFLIWTRRWCWPLFRLQSCRDNVAHFIHVCCQHRECTQSSGWFPSFLPSSPHQPKQEEGYSLKKTGGKVCGRWHKPGRRGLRGERGHVMLAVSVFFPSLYIATCVWVKQTPPGWVQPTSPRGAQSALCALELTLFSLASTEHKTGSPFATLPLHSEVLLSRLPLHPFLPCPPPWSLPSSQPTVTSSCLLPGVSQGRTNRSGGASSVGFWPWEARFQVEESVRAYAHRPWSLHHFLGSLRPLGACWWGWDCHQARVWRNVNPLHLTLSGVPGRGLAQAELPEAQSDWAGAGGPGLTYTWPGDFRAPSPPP